MQSRPYVVGMVCAFIAALGFSFKAILVKLAYQEPVDAITLLLLRMLFAAPFFIAMALYAHFRQPLQISSRDKGLLLLIGFLGYYLSSLLDFMGLFYISAGLERMILFLFPTFTVLLLALIEKRAISRSVQFALFLSYLGIVLVFLHDLDHPQKNLVLGSSLVLASTVTYAVYLVLAGKLVQRVGTLRFTAYPMLVSGSLYLLHFGLTHALPVLSTRVYQLSLLMALCSTVIPSLLLAIAIRHLGSAQTSLVGTAGPVLTLYLAYVFLGETITPLQIVGCILILAGVTVISLTGKKT